MVKNIFLNCFLGIYAKEKSWTALFLTPVHDFELYIQKEQFKNIFLYGLYRTK